MLTAEKVKEVVRACGADLVGIASMDRFEGSPKQMDPRYIFPDAKVMIVFGFRILRGTLRGIEEGTYFSAYSSMGYASINVLRQPMVTWEFATFLEDNGYEAVPIRTFWGATDISGVQGADVNTPRENWSRPVAPDKPYPDVSVNMRIA
ncbi:MAG TPA: (4Fe-4S)-binding protein, partial [Armatimonadota bacterium]|nr:(4Fe-4S)-binding protein [Armatimonadota bacterium]